MVSRRLWTCLHHAFKRPRVISQSLSSAAATTRPQNATVNEALPPIFRFDISASNAVLPPDYNRDAPRSPTFYSPKSHLADFMLLLEETLSRLSVLSEGQREALSPVEDGAEKSTVRWLNRADMADALGGVINVADYHLIMTRLSRLVELIGHPDALQGGPHDICYRQLQKVMSTLPAEASQAAQTSYEALKNKSRPPLVRQQAGRWYARVSRKSAVAKVWLSTEVADPRSPQLLVNGRSLADYFSNPVYQQRVLRPLTLVDWLQKCDVTLHVEGGGLASQAEAAQHALCRAIYSADPTQEPQLLAGTILQLHSRDL